MKIFKPNCDAVISILNQVLNEQKHLGKTLETVVNLNKKLGARDRNFIAGNVFEIIRYLRYYAEVSAAVGSVTKYNINQLFAARLLHQNIELPEWFPLADDCKNTIVENLKKQYKNAVFMAYTDWFYEQGENAYKEQWLPIATALNASAAVCIRVNTLKTSCEKLQNDLASENLQFEKASTVKNALYFTQHKKLTNLPAYQNGLFEFQDISSQQVVAFCEAKSGMTVIDACAGAGGKSLQFACEMNNRGIIYSLDIHENKLRELEKRAAKSGVKIIETHQITNGFEADKTALKQKADIVLIDAPCSGSGVIKRNPENKWNLEENWVSSIVKTQAEILRSYSSFVKKGGSLIYATCSILPQENQEQIQRFLAENSDFVFIKEQLLLPGINTNFDGFYMAKLQRK